MRTLIKITGIILILFIAGCCDEDFDLKHPVNTNLVIRFVPGFTTEGDIYYNYTKGLIGIEKIEFEGIREEGENVFFDTDLENDPSPIPELKGEHEATLSDFDLPQGIYKFIRIDIYLAGLSDSELTGYDETDLVHKGFVIEGLYEHYWWSREFGIPDSIYSIPFVLAIDNTEKFVFRSFENVVIKKPDCKISLCFFLENAFTSIDYKSFEKAEISGDSTNQKILISSNQNRDLYDILIYRLGVTATMLVD